MATPQTPSEIREAVQDHLEQTQSLRTRMDDDFRRWWVQRLYNTNPDGGDAFRSYTSDRAKTVADKVVGTMADAAMHLRCPFGDTADEDFQARCNDKERVARGMLNKANDLLTDLLQQPFQSDSAWYTACRGWAGARVLLTKDEQGVTDVDLKHWDIRHTYWGMGRRGLDWVCYRIERTAAQVEAEYGVRPPGRQDKDRLDVYEFFDRQMGSVVVDDVFVKPPTPHAGTLIRKVPFVLVPVGLSPLIQSRDATSSQYGSSDTTGNQIASYGESIWATGRHVFDVENEVLSVYLEHVAKGREQGYVLTSPNAEKGLEDNPDETSTVIQLATDEKLDPIPRPDLTADTAQLTAIVSGEGQKATLPDSAFGNAPFALSGIAFDILNSSQLSMLTPRLHAMERLTEGAVNMLIDMYSSGAFEPMEVSGFADNKQYFSITIEPERLRNLPPINIEFTAQLPQDDVAMLQFAQMARDGVFPLLSDEWLRENKMGIMDEKAEADRVNHQVAQRSSPIALDLTLGRAAADRDDDVLAETYLIDAMVERFRQQFELVVAQFRASSVGGGTGGGSTPGTQPRGGSTLRQTPQPDQREAEGASRLRTDR